MAARTLRSSSRLTGVEPRTTRDTVDGDTPARFATSVSVGRAPRSDLLRSDLMIAFSLPDCDGGGAAILL
jgi:hypothetical protein